MLVGLPSEVHEEIFNWCQRSDILNVALTCSEMYTETVKMLLWKTVRIDLDQLKLNKHQFPYLKHTKCLTLFKNKEKKLSFYGTDEEEMDYLCGRYYSGSSSGEKFDYEKAVWEWNNEQKAWDEWRADLEHHEYIQFRREMDEDFYLPHYFERISEQQINRFSEPVAQQDEKEVETESTGFMSDEEFYRSEEMETPNDNLDLSQVDLSKLTELRLSDIHAMVCKNVRGDYYSEHSSDVLESLLRNLKNLSSLRVVHMSSLRVNQGWETDFNNLQNKLCSIDDRVYLMTKDEYQHIEDIPYLRELKFTNIWIGKPFEIPTLEKLSVNFYTKFRIELGRMEKLLEFEGSHVTVVGEDILVGVKNLQKLKLSRCGNITGEGLRAIAKHPNITELDIRDNEIADIELMNLKWMVLLNTLKFGNTKKERSCYFFDARAERKITCLDFLKNLKHLQELMILNAEISDSGAKLICHLENLEKLSIRGSLIAGGGVFTFLSQLPKLRHFDISHCDRSNQSQNDRRSSSNRGYFRTDRHAANSSSNNAIAKLSQIKSLETLDMENFKGVTGAAFVNFTSLRYLNMQDNEIGDSDLEYIARLTTLGELKISLNEEVTEKGFWRLCKLPHLKNLYVWDNDPMFDIVQSVNLKRREEKLPYCCVTVGGRR